MRYTKLIFKDNQSKNISTTLKATDQDFINSSYIMELEVSQSCNIANAI